MKDFKYFIFIIIALNFIACRKTEKGDAKFASFTKPLSMSAKSDFSDFPQVENEMLKFRDNDQYDRYVDFLDQTMTNSDSDDSTFDADDALLSIEKKLGFISIRSISHAEFMRKNETGWASAEEIPEEHFLQSLDLRSVLNKDLEVQIGPEIIHYINKDYAVRVEAKNRDIISKYRLLGGNITLDDILNVDILQQFTTIVELTGLGNIWDRPITPIPLGDYNITRAYYSFPSPCENPYLVKFIGISCLWNAEPRGLEGYFLVTFGDGTPSQRIDIVPVLGGYGTGNFSHVFQKTGKLIMTFQAYSPTGAWRKTKTQEIEVANSSCQPIEKKSEWRYKMAINNSDHMVGGRLYVEFYGSQNLKMRMIAETKSYVRKSGNVFHLGKGRIEVAAECSAKDEDCNEIDNLQAYQLKTNSKALLEHRSKSERFRWNTANSIHSLTVDGVVTSLPITITPCP